MTSSLSQPSPSLSCCNRQKPQQSEYLSSMLDTIPDRIWDDAAASLLEKGVATVRLSVTPEENQVISPSPSSSTTSLNKIHARAFRSARTALDRVLYQGRDCLDGGSGGGGGGGNNNADDNNACPLLPMIAPDADSAHVTGFHQVGGMSRYNVGREGIVFSDEGSTCTNCCSCCDCQNKNDYRGCYLSDLSGMFHSLHGIADRVLLAIEKKLELSLPSPAPAPSLPEQSQPDDDSQTKNNITDSIEFGQKNVGWFQRHLGPTETASQWHMKRFVQDEDEKLQKDDAVETAATLTDDPTTSSSSALLTETGERITLPMHTDPSLISVVIHDNDNGSSGGALGLQYYHPRERTWVEPEAHGHSVATIFVGSVLAHLTSGRYPAAKHRVVEKQHEHEHEQKQRQRQQRMAATLFVRPQPSALLQVPLPSPWLLQQQIKEEQEQNEKEEGNDNINNNNNNNDTNCKNINNNKNITSKKNKKSSSKQKPPITFEAWLKRVAKNYEKQKKKQKNKKKAVII